MTIDERLERLTDRHEALTETVELIGEHVREVAENIDRMAEQHDRETTAISRELRRAVRLGVAEARNERQRRQALDEYITKLAAAQLVTEEKMQVLEEKLVRFIDASRHSGNGHE